MIWNCDFNGIGIARSHFFSGIGISMGLFLIFFNFIDFQGESHCSYWDFIGFHRLLCGDLTCMALNGQFLGRENKNGWHLNTSVCLNYLGFNHKGSFHQSLINLCGSRCRGPIPYLFLRATRSQSTPDLTSWIVSPQLVNNPCSKRGWLLNERRTLPWDCNQQSLLSQCRDHAIEAGLYDNAIKKVV